MPGFCTTDAASDGITTISRYSHQLDRRMHFPCYVLCCLKWLPGSIFFRGERGFGQVDPLFPYLLVMALESVSPPLDDWTAPGLLKYYPECKYIYTHTHAHIYIDLTRHHIHGWSDDLLWKLTTISERELQMPALAESTDFQMNAVKPELFCNGINDD